MNKSFSLTILKCALFSCVVVLQTLINLPEFGEKAKLYLAIGTSAVVLFQNVFEQKIRLAYKQKKHANPPPVQVSYEDIVPVSLPQTVQSLPQNIQQSPQFENRSLQFIHNLAKPSGIRENGPKTLPERYTEYSQYGIADFEGQRNIGIRPDLQYSINSNTPVLNFV